MTKVIDWEEVRNRLKESQLGLERALGASEQRREAVYRERAAQLAGRRIESGTPVATLRVLVFSLGGERYALEFGDLAELLPFSDCAPVPGGPAPLLGVSNIHGEIRSVLDLGRLLELTDPASDPPTSGYILLVRKQGREVALRVDHTDKIRSLSPGDLSRPAEAETTGSTRYVKALTSDRLRVLSTEAILAHPIFGGSSS